ncbi:MAG: cytochrome b [Hyphomicrobium sp.]|nr:cytochrome b [Hyphomicrobium sp.]
MIWNSGYYWGIPARILHWLAAFVLVIVYLHGSIVLDDWDEHGGSGRGALLWHAAAGATLGAVMLLRLLWRGVNKTPMLPAATSDWERRAAHLTHVSLYALTFVAVLTGWLLADGLKPPVEVKLLWSIPVPVSGLHLGWSARKLIKGLHELSAQLVMALAAAHAVAALWHHFIKRDSVMRRMLLRGRQRNRVGD